MTGKPLRSYAEIKEPRPPKPRSEVRKVNRSRGGHRFPNVVCEPLREFVRGLPCLLAGQRDRNGIRHVCRGPVACCHLKARGAAGPDFDNVFPGCQWGAHQDQEGHTREFEWTWRVHLKPICRKVTSLFLRAYPELRKRRVVSPTPRGRA